MRRYSRDLRDRQTGKRPYSPRFLFANGVQGFWYDPSDLSTLFQDVAGTVPVTGVEQPVALMLDKSGRGNHARQSTAIDRPILRMDAGGKYYLVANGANTGMQTSAIDFTGTNKMTLFAGARKMGDAGTGMLMELSTTINTNLGSFALRAPHTAGADFGALFNGTVLAGSVSPTSYPSPISVVLCATGDIPADRTTLRVNGSQVASSTGDLGAGNFGNYPLYLFRRGSGGVAFNGWCYGMLVRGAASTAPEISRFERWMSLRTGVTL